MRKLITKDIPAFARLIQKTGAREKLKELARDKTGHPAEEAWDIGFDLLADLLFSISEPENEAAAYAFLAGPFEMDASIVANLPLDELVGLLKRLAEENNLGPFFASAFSVKA